jgi:anti-sigma factor RsiW
VNIERLHELIDGHLDGSLTESEAQELSAVLAEDRRARREFWSRAAIHGLLPEAVHLAWLAEATPGESSKVVPMPIGGVSPRVLRVLRYATLAAAACVVIAVAWWGRQRSLEDQSVATWPAVRVRSGMVQAKSSAGRGSSRAATGSRRARLSFVFAAERK